MLQKLQSRHAKNDLKSSMIFLKSAFRASHLWALQHQKMIEMKEFFASKHQSWSAKNHLKSHMFFPKSTFRASHLWALQHRKMIEMKEIFALKTSISECQKSFEIPHDFWHSEIDVLKQIFLSFLLFSDAGALIDETHGK